MHRRKSRCFWLSCQRRKVKDFFIKFTKKSHFADFLTKHTLDFVLHRLFGGLAEMDTDDIGGLANLLSDSRASGGVVAVLFIQNPPVNEKVPGNYSSSGGVGMREQGKAATLRYL